MVVNWIVFIVICLATVAYVGLIVRMIRKNRRDENKSRSD